VIYTKIFPYLIFGISRKLISYTKIGKEIEKCFKIMENFKNSVVIKNTPNSDDNSVISLLLNHKNEFSDTEIFDEMFLIALAVSLLTIKLIANIFNDSKNISRPTTHHQK
jgi:hypothetical protein